MAVNDITVPCTIHMSLSGPLGLDLFSGDIVIWVQETKVEELKELIERAFETLVEGGWDERKV